MINEILKNRQDYSSIEKHLTYDNLIKMDSIYLSKLMQNIKFKKVMHQAATVI